LRAERLLGVATDSVRVQDAVVVYRGGTMRRVEESAVARERGLGSSHGDAARAGALGPSTIFCAPDHRIGIPTPTMVASHSD